MKRLWLKIREFLEVIYDPTEDLPKISHAHLIDLNAAWRRNIWYDKKGQRWPLRDSL